ncbi:MAG: hypothetical protein ABW292_19620 [Vicinamibacterales bacterium]
MLGGLALLAVAALIPTHQPGATSVPAPLTLDAMKDIIVGKAAYVGRFRQ